MAVVSKQNPLKHYVWGNDCHGWNLVDIANMGIKLEMMPAHTSEQLHYHKKAVQFFFILKGTATFEIDSKKTEVKENEGITILNTVPHKISNETDTDLEFLLTSQPTTNGDRHNL